MTLLQQISFCTTADGVRIAHTATGQGEPLVRAGTWLSHLECDAQEADAVARIGDLSRRHSLVRYDARGCGLSDRRIDKLELDDLVADLEAVVDARGLQRFALLGISMGAAIAIRYAVKHPQRVSRMVLMGGFARSYFSARNLSPQAREEADLILRSVQVGWGNPKSSFRHLFMAQLLSEPTPEQQRALDERMRLSMTSEMAHLYLRHNYTIDVTADCGLVSCPTLVFHARRDEMITFEQGRKLAALIPGSRFFPLDCAGHHLLWSEPAARIFLQELEQFLGTSDKPQLTQRQLQVLRLIAAGQTDKQIARELNLSPRTVEMHVAGAFKALGTSTRAEAVHAATQHGLLRG